jgi:23S rRNA (adenine2503-C2)-methyltransferase
VTNLIGLTKSQLASALNTNDFRIKQIWGWIYGKGAKSFDEMTNLAKDFRRSLKENFLLERSTISRDLMSIDFTRKFLIKFYDKNEVEVVFIPEKNRGTLCISSQIGCTLSCKFCHTGTQTLVRNLEASEIVMQVVIAKDLLLDWNNNFNRKITNIVFMGMGEPFFNYENVKKAVEILSDSEGINFSSRKITISTSGLVPEILRAANEIKTNLAISLHATNDKLRSEIMGINKKYPLESLMNACKQHNIINPTQKIMFEYVMLKDVNDYYKNAFELIKILKKFNLNCKVNLIPFNAWEGSPYKPSSDEQIYEFAKILKENGILTTIRKARGQDVMAACGQLKSSSKKIPQWKIRQNEDA